MSLIDIDKITIDQLPAEEDDYFEFKSSRTKSQALGEKLQKAVSGFANSGGGYFIVGIDAKTGMADGGSGPAIFDKVALPCNLSS